jgi:hypothetical protein
MPEFGVVPGPWGLGKGKLGESEKRPIMVGGGPSVHGLGTLPPAKPEAMIVKYHLPAEAQTFVGAVAIDDSSTGVHSPVTFEVYGDGKRLWDAQRMRARGHKRGFQIGVAGMKVLELRVFCTGDGPPCHSVWVEPRILAR